MMLIMSTIRYTHKDPARTAVAELGGVASASALAGVTRKRVYQWMWRGNIPTEDIRALIQNSHARGTPVPVSLLLGLPPEQITV